MLTAFDAGDPRPELHPGDLPKEVAAREVELRVLRAEVEAKEQEAAQLHEEVREAEMKLHQASGNVGTLSAKLETASAGQHAVMEASAKHVDGQVAGLRRRLARHEWELGEKEEEIATLRQAVTAGQRLVAQQTGDLRMLQQSHSEQGQQVALLTEDQTRLQRHKAISDWRVRVQVQIEQEQIDASLIRDRRERLQQIDALNEELGTFRAYIARMEDKCNHHVAQIARQQQHFDELVMEERLCMSAAKLGNETASAQKLQHIDEHRELEARIAEERARKGARAGHAQAYDAAEASVGRHQEELASLIALTREISKTLAAPDLRGSSDALEAAMGAFLRAMRDLGEEAPSVVRIGPGEYRVAGEAVRCVLSEGGRLCVRDPQGGLVLMGDYIKRRGLARQHGSIDSTVAGHSRASPLPSQAYAPPPSMSGLFQPVAVGSAGHLMAV